MLVLLVSLLYIFIIIIKMVISVVPYITSKGEYAMLYKINENVYIKTSKIIII